MARPARAAFTLIELLIVVVVIVTLMGIVFRLSGMGGESKARGITIRRLNAIEFALSGYNAAFGSYPPVEIHGQRDIYLEVDGSGLQYTTGQKYSPSSLGSSSGAAEYWKHVKAACRSQPVAAEFPMNAKRTRQHDTTGKYNGFNLLGEGENISSLVSAKNWNQARIFKFGLMSYLLPRLQFMLEGASDLYDRGGFWRERNRLSALYNFATGESLTPTWDDVQRRMNAGRHWQEGKRENTDLREVINQPSQLVCARWMSAFEGIVHNGKTFYNVNTYDGTVGRSSGEGDGSYSLSGSVSGGSGQMCMLSCMTVVDGWGHDFYYYSDPPYQNYRLWSAGPDGMTFPPWMDLKQLPSAERELAGDWMADDIVSMSN